MCSWGEGKGIITPRGASGEPVSLCLPPSPWSPGCMLCLPAARSSVETDGLDEVCDGKRPAASVRGEPMERRWSCPTFDSDSDGDGDDPAARLPAATSSIRIASSSSSSRRCEQESSSVLVSPRAPAEARRVPCYQGRSGLERP